MRFGTQTGNTLTPQNSIRNMVRDRPRLLANRKRLLTAVCFIHVALSYIRGWNGLTSISSSSSRDFATENGREDVDEHITGWGHSTDVTYYTGRGVNNDKVLGQPALPTVAGLEAPVGHNTTSSIYHNNNDNTITSNLKFYIIAIPETTSDLLVLEGNNGTTSSSSPPPEGRPASVYYQKALNEESAEIWLHRGFEHLLAEQRTHDPTKADIFVVVGYLHLHRGISIQRGGNDRSRGEGNGDAAAGNPQSIQRFDFVRKCKSLLVDTTKPHLLLIPSWNPKVSREVGIHALVNMLHASGVKQIWSVGFERNPAWQGVKIPVSRIVPIPYVIRMSLSAPQPIPSWSSSSSSSSFSSPSLPTTVSSVLIPPVNNFSRSSASAQAVRQENFVFYAGDARRNAESWAGCFRSKLILPLQEPNHHQQSGTDNGTTTTTSSADDGGSNQMVHIHNMDVRLVDKHSRLDESTYNLRMSTSEYCLILCGDTPTSRSLTAAMVAGCIPLRIGSRLRGGCEPPCQNKFGWTITGYEYPHLPYTETIPWEEFPEVNEQAFMEDGRRVLNELFQRYDTGRKARLYSVMDHVRPGWIYGYGDPVPSSSIPESEDPPLGEAVRYIWRSFVVALQNDQIANSVGR